jgi:hypothetical protein
VAAFVALGAAAFLAPPATGAATTGAATTGVATGAATVLASVFLETVFLEAGAVVLIILVAVEVFMAGIRIVKSPLESIFDPLYILAGVKKILQ